MRVNLQFNLAKGRPDLNQPISTVVVHQVIFTGLDTLGVLDNTYVIFSRFEEKALAPL